MTGMPELLRKRPLSGNEKGSAGQDYVSSMAKLRGIEVARPEPDNGTDLLMSNGETFIRVQVKTRFEAESKSISATQEGGGHYKSVVDCFIVVDFVPLSLGCLPKLFVVPCCDLSDTLRVVMLSAIQEYENRWDLLFCDHSDREVRGIGIRDSVVVSAISKFSSLGYSASPVGGRPPGVLSVTNHSGQGIIVCMCKTIQETRCGLTKYGFRAPADFSADWLVAHDPSSGVFVFISRDEVMSLSVRKNGSRRSERSAGSPCINAFHLLEGSGTDAPRTNDH